VVIVNKKGVEVSFAISLPVARFGGIAGLRRASSGLAPEVRF